jgi:hypothetical protein
MSRPPPYIEGRGLHTGYNTKGNPVYTYDIVRNGVVQPPTHAGMDAYGIEHRVSTPAQLAHLGKLKELEQRERNLASGGAPGSGMSPTTQLTLIISILVIQIQENMHFNQALDIETLQKIQGNIEILREIYESGLAYDPITIFFEQRLQFYITKFNLLGGTLIARKLFVDLLNQLFLELGTVYNQEKEAEKAASVYAETVHPRVSSQLSQPLPPALITEADWRKWQTTQAPHLILTGSVPNNSLNSYTKWRTSGGRRSKSRKNRRSKSRRRRNRK